MAEPPAEADRLAEPPSEGLKEPPAEAGVKEPPGSEGVKEPPGRDGVKEPPAPTACRTPGAAAPAATPAQPPPTGVVPAPRAYWISLGVGAAVLVAFYALLSFTRLEVFKMLLTSFFPLLVLILAVLGSIVMGLATPLGGGGGGRVGRLPAGSGLSTADLRRRQGKRVPHRQDLGNGLLAVRRFGDLLGGVRLLGGQELVERWVLSMNLSARPSS